MQSLQSLLKKIESSDPDQVCELAGDLLSQSRERGAVQFQVKALGYLAICAKKTGKTADAEKYAREAIELSEQQGFQRELLLNINTLAGIKLVQGKHTQVLELLEQYLPQATQSGFTAEQARFLTNLGIVNELLGHYPAALEHNLQAIALYRQLPKSPNLAYSLHNVANIYMWLELYSESVGYNQEAINLLEELGVTHGQAIILNGLGEAFYLQGDFTEAEAFHDNAISLARETGDYHELADSLLQRAKCSNIPGAEILTKGMLDEALQLCLTSGEKGLQAGIMLQYGAMYLKQENFPQALEALQQTIGLAEYSESNEILWNAYKLFSEASEKSENIADAFKYLSLYTELREEIKGIKVINQMQAIALPFKLRAAHAEAEVLRLKNKDLEVLSKYDHLTGLANRRYLQQQMEVLWQQGSLSLLVLDIDLFKQINDQFLHTVGDQVLKKCGEILLSACQKTGLAARFGGEEFVLLLPEVGLAEAVVTAEKLRLEFENNDWEQEAKGLKVTVSIGIAHSSEKNNIESVLQLADSRLYHAKRSGRNRTIPDANIGSDHSLPTQNTLQ